MNPKVRNWQGELAGSNAGARPEGLAQLRATAQDAGEIGGGTTQADCAPKELVQCAGKEKLERSGHSCPHGGLERNRNVHVARNVLTRAWNAARTERSGPDGGQWVERALRSRRLHRCRTTGAVPATEQSLVLALVRHRD